MQDAIHDVFAYMGLTEDEARRESQVYEGFTCATINELMSELYQRGVTPQDYETYFANSYARDETLSGREREALQEDIA